MKEKIEKIEKIEGKPMTKQTLSRRDFLKGMAAGAALLGSADWMAGLDERPASDHPWAAGADQALALRQGDAALDPDAAAVMRLTFGPRPADLARVREIGVDAWIEEQLHPETIADEEMDALLLRFPALSMTLTELVNTYHLPAAGADAAKPPEDDPRGDESPPPNTGNPAPPRFPQTAIRELVTATVLRAAFSRRQLYELMVDFWSNHFNIYVLKEANRMFKIVDDREVIRKHALGKFGDLLQASAKSPAMLVYLDNLSNKAGVAQENYARELLELHTLGVNGGYTQTDVQETARVLTGWTVRQIKRGVQGAGANVGEFVFDPTTHDTGDKVVLGLKIKGGGVEEGERLLAMLARHPSTAKFIAVKLVRRFVADDPPPALVGRVAATFLESGGDIRQVLATLLRSAEFKAAAGRKVKRPLEYAVSAARALDIQPFGPALKARTPSAAVAAGPLPASFGQMLFDALLDMGQAPFYWPTPDGYPDQAAAWINTANLLARWNLALMLTSGKGAGALFQPDTHEGSAALKTAPEAVDYWTDRLLHRPLPAAARQHLLDFMGQNVSMAGQRQLVAMILASPTFQMR